MSVHIIPATMSTNAIIKASNLTIQNVTIGDLRLGNKGNKTVPIKYSGQSLQIRLPKLTYPMGINIKQTDNGTDYKLSASFHGCDPYAKEKVRTVETEVQNLYNFILDLQAKLLDTAVANSVKWFGKSRDKAVLADIMKQSLSPSVTKVNGEWVPNGQYPPSLRMKVPVYDGKVSMSVAQGGSDIEVEVEDLPRLFPKHVAAAVVVTPSIYISGQGFGITWRITYASVSAPTRMTASKIFSDEIEEEVVSSSSTAAVEDEEQQQEEEQVEETPTAPAPAPEPTPAPAPVKGNRRRVVGAS